MPPKCKALGELISPDLKAYRHSENCKSVHLIHCMYIASNTLILSKNPADIVELLAARLEPHFFALKVISPTAPPAFIHFNCTEIACFLVSTYLSK